MTVAVTTLGNESSLTQAPIAATAETANATSVDETTTSATWTPPAAKPVTDIRERILSFYLMDYFIRIRL